MLNFILMNEDSWERSKNVTAYAIDPDTARSVLASDVNYHYMMKYGAIFATSFVQGYASAIQSSASTSTTGIFGTSTTHPELSPSQKLATAIGQIGTNLGSVTQNYTNIPPTVTVDSGVSLGILFMADVA
jgi:intracellular multiplication protein IcmE